MENSQNKEYQQSTTFKKQEFEDLAGGQPWTTSRSQIEFFEDAAEGVACSDPKNQQKSPLKRIQRSRYQQHQSDLGEIQPTPISKESLSRCQGCAIIALLLLVLASQGFLVLHLHKSGNSDRIGISRAIWEDLVKQDAQKTRKKTKPPKPAPNSVKLIEEPTENLIIEEFTKNGKKYTRVAFKNQIKGLSEKLDRIEKSLKLLKNQGKSTSKKIDALTKKMSEPQCPAKDLLKDLKTDVGIIKTQTPQKTFEMNEKVFWLLQNVEVVADHNDHHHIGGPFTLTAVKDPKSYLIGTKNKGYVLVENGVKIDEKPFDKDISDFMSIVYVKKSNCYFLLINNKLYKKRIDKSSLELWAEIEGGIGWNVHTPLIYSEKQNRIWTVKHIQPIVVVINAEEKGIEAEIKLPKGHYISDFGFIGENDEYVASISQSSFLSLMKYDTRQKLGHVVSNQYLTIPQCGHSYNLGTDSRNKVILISSKQLTHKGSITSCLTAFELWGGKFTQMASISRKNAVELEAVEFEGYYGSFATFVAVDRQNGGSVHIFRYDVHQKVLKSDVHKRIPHQEAQTFNIVRNEGYFYYTGDYGKVMRFNLIDARQK